MKPTTSKPVGPTTVKPTGPTTAKPTASCDCGNAVRKNKIVNGVETEANEYPWHIGLTNGPGWGAYCGGSIISKKDILTAAHCTDGQKAEDIYILVGAHDQSQMSASDHKRVCKITEHSNYDGSTFNNDFAILTLCDPLEFSEKIAPVCMPPSNGQGVEYEGVDSIVSGWGTTSSGGSISYVLLETTVKTMTNQQCYSDPYKYYQSQIQDAMICAANPNTDSCQGDSGGPLITKEASTGRYTQTGVVSWGRGCALADYPGVYARVTKAVDWIKANTEEGVCSA